jgi:hypothetical protein
MKRTLARHGEQLFLVIILLLFVIAPTPGDIGGCGQEADLLDAPTFYVTKRSIDCRQCNDCGLVFTSCQDACDVYAPVPESFPVGCFPLVHDGEVCLRALTNATCGDYAKYVDDNPASRSTPTECNFCPTR